MTESERTSDKADRLRAALRENLKRRKAQAKGRLASERDQQAGPESSTPAHDSAGFGADKQNRK